MSSRTHIAVWFERFWHLAAIGVSITAAFLLRFDFSIPHSVAPMLWRAVFAALVVKLPVFEGAGLYRGLRRFAGIADLYRVFLCNVVGSVLFGVITAFWIGPSMPRSVWLIDAVLCFLITAAMRFSDRLRNEAMLRDASTEARKGILIYGAGAAGAELLHEIRGNRAARYDVRAFLDDDQSKHGASVDGVRVLGSGRDAASIVRRLNGRNRMIEEIILAMPSATGRQLREAVANCRAAGLHFKTVPGIDELLSGRVQITQARKVSLEDLLGRKPVRLDERTVRASVAGRSVMVTGAAGSIGSELCRQLASFGPASLVALDQSESELFRLENELREKFPNLELIATLGNIRDADRLSEVIERQNVESVFHAAAYKHVPLMQTHVFEAARNNILGTWNIARAARQHGVRNLLMISSDKAVNPICVMGATKRVCERIVSARCGEETHGASVRFGNVLGSSGSVVPIFQAQIATGGPVKVTHPDVRRYFMTVTEAVSLVIQASSQSQGSEIFVLDMGEPIRIVDLAENMIRLAGLVPYEDIDIQFTGLRPGEKLMEELIGGGSVSSIYQNKIRIIREQPLDWHLLTEWIGELEYVLKTRAEQDVHAHLHRLVPEYEPCQDQLTEERERARAECEVAKEQSKTIASDTLAAADSQKRASPQFGEELAPSVP